MSKSKRARWSKPRSASKTRSKADTPKSLGPHYGMRANSKQAQVVALPHGSAAVLNSPFVSAAAFKP